MNIWRKNTLTGNPCDAAELVGSSSEKEFQEVYKKLQVLENTSRQLNKDVKKYNEVLASVHKTEVQMAKALSSCAQTLDDETLRAQAEAYMSITEQSSEEVNKVTSINQKLLLDPLKNYNTAFTGLAGHIRKRDAAYQELQKNTNKLQKLQEKEKTGSNVSKAGELKRTISKEKEEFAELNSSLLSDMKQFEDKKGEYVSPCLQALVQSQTEYYGNSTNLYANLVNDGTLSTAHFQDKFDSLVSDIKDLFIVATK